MYRTVFDQEIGPPPPSTVDVDRVIRRRRRRRRAFTAATAVAAGSVAVAAVVGTLAALPGSSGEDTGGRGPSGSVSASGPGSASPSSSASAPATDDTSVRLTGVLRDYLAAGLPGAQYDREPAFTHQKRDAKKEIPGVQGAQTAEDYYYTHVELHTATVGGSIDVGVGYNDPEKLGVTATCPPDGPLDASSYDCRMRAGPAYETVMIEQVTGAGWISYRIEVIRPSGMAVFVQVRNQANQGQEARWPKPPLTVDEAVDLANRSDLTL